MIRRMPLKRKRSTPRRSGRLHDVSYLEQVRQESCLAQYFIRSALRGSEVWGGINIAMGDHFDCYGPMHAHHMREMGGAGMGQKDDDTLCTPLCQEHHSQWHSASGIFKNKNKGWRRAFALAAVTVTRERLASRGVKNPREEM